MLPAPESGLAGTGLAHGAFVGSGDGFGVAFAGKADDHERRKVAAGERVEQSLLGHAVVAFGRGGGHTALVAPENLPARPVEVFACGQGCVHGARGGAAGKGDAKEAALADRDVGGRGDELLGHHGQVSGGSDDFDLLAGAAD